MIITSSDNFIKDVGEGRNTAVALGFFDGVHRAHREIIQSALEACGENLLPCVHTFSSPPHKMVDDQPVPVLTPPDVKSALLAHLGVAVEIVDAFSPSLMHLTPDQFFSEILVGRLRAKVLCAGFHYRFGYRKQGDAHTLRALGEKYGVEVVILPPVLLHGELVSSSKIRALLSEGRIREANEFLGYRFFLRGKVISGRQIGRTIGICTANLDLPADVVLPQAGVYVTNCLVGEKSFRSVTNVGDNPTVGGKRITVESHVLDFSGDLYGQTIDVVFLSRIRGEMRFPSKEALRAQVQRDIETARCYLAD